MIMEETNVFKNSFGSVTNKRVVLQYKNGTEDIPISQISSISFQRKRNHFLSFGSFVIAIALACILGIQLENASGVEVLILFVLIVFSLFSGIANRVGHHEILISAGGKDRKALKVEFAKTKDGLEFVDAIKKTLVNLS
ncbi:MAG TPA: hypothetical protein DCR46_08145 [Cytophagales bacterium]|nr:hypothetical protein [Cytophagales bacterium]